MGSVAHEPPWRRETRGLNGKTRAEPDRFTSPGLDKSRKSRARRPRAGQHPARITNQPADDPDNVWDYLFVKA
jgi:hypothetical protein